MIDPTESQLADYFSAEQDRPVIFVNCHRYHERARYPADYAQPGLAPGVSGREAYHRYLERVEANFMPQVGGRLLLAGPVAQILIGECDWDEVVIGEYPSRAEAMRLPTLPGYAEIVVHRIAGLATAETLALNQNELFRLVIPDAWRYRR